MIIGKINSVRHMVRNILFRGTCVAHVLVASLFFSASAKAAGIIDSAGVSAGVYRATTTIFGYESSDGSDLSDRMYSSTRWSPAFSLFTRFHTPYKYLTLAPTVHVYSLTPPFSEPQHIVQAQLDVDIDIIPKSLSDRIRFLLGFHFGTIANTDGRIPFLAGGQASLLLPVGENLNVFGRIGFDFVALPNKGMNSAPPAMYYEDDFLYSRIVQPAIGASYNF